MQDEFELTCILSDLDPRILVFDDNVIETFGITHVVFIDVEKLKILSEHLQVLLEVLNHVSLALFAWGLQKD